MSVLFQFSYVALYAPLSCALSSRPKSLQDQSLGEVIF